VDDAVGGEDIYCDEPGVEVDGWAFECYADGEALVVAERVLGLARKLEEASSDGGLLGYLPCTELG